VADVIEEAIDVPFIHLADTTASAVKQAGLVRVALLGTRFTMEEDFYRGRLEKTHDIKVMVPGEADRARVHDVIYRELVRGVVSEDSRKQYLDIIDRLLAEGAEGVIAGCTEIELLVPPQDVDCPYFPTTRLHALAAVDAALASTLSPWKGRRPKDESSSCDRRCPSACSPLRPDARISMLGRDRRHGDVGDAAWLAFAG
jgi:amino-acid racemase